MSNSAWYFIDGDGPLVAAAIHAGHELRSEVAGQIALDDAERLREEDPYTEDWTKVASTRIVGTRSRFEFDLNRPRDKAVYLRPQDAWGLTVWRQPPSEPLIAASLALYDQFYQELQARLETLLQHHRQIVVYDIHSYNHRRQGPQAPAADRDLNPEVNVGTGTMDRQAWSHVVDRFLSDLRAFDFDGRQLDVRENVKFLGGHFPRWIHQQFPGRVCVLSLEFKKLFMDEWTGVKDPQHVTLIAAALASTIPGVIEQLAQPNTEHRTLKTEH